MSGERQGFINGGGEENYKENRAYHEKQGDERGGGGGKKLWKAESLWGGREGGYPEKERTHGDLGGLLGIRTERRGYRDRRGEGGT